MISTDQRWHDRDHVLQTLHIPPCVQLVLPDDVISEQELPEHFVQYISEKDLDRLATLARITFRTAATRFFNLPSARDCLERGLRSEREAIASWLATEKTARHSFDFFGGPHEPLAGYGILVKEPKKLRTTKTVRFIVQRGEDSKYLLWSAYPLLSPRAACWIDDYQYASHPPATPLAPVFYYFLSNYLSVTSDCLYVDAALQGTTDFYLYEPRASFEELCNVVHKLNPQNLARRDAEHLCYELRSRCLDETLPDHYLDQPHVLVEALQQSLDTLANYAQKS